MLFYLWQNNDIADKAMGSVDYIIIHVFIDSIEDHRILVESWDRTSKRV